MLFLPQPAAASPTEHPSAVDDRPEIPSFWLGIVLALAFGVVLRILPIGMGPGVEGLDTLRHLTLPALTIACALTPILVRTLLRSLIEVLNSDCVTTGRAMGLARQYLL